jgi:hypothetical protein
MPYRRTADTGCPDGPCPVMARNDDRGTVALQGYDPQEDLDLAMGLQPPKESRIEMRSEVFLDLLAQHLTEADLEQIAARRAEMRAAV